MKKTSDPLIKWSKDVIHSVFPGLSRFHVMLFGATQQETLDLFMVKEAYMEMLYEEGLDYDFDTDAMLIDIDSDTSDDE